MEPSVVFFTGFQLNDLWFLAEAAGRTLLISTLSIALGSIAGLIFGWILSEGRLWAVVVLGPILDIFRSVPLIIQLVLFYNFAPIVGLNLDPFISGTVVLTVYCAALVASVARGGISAVERPMRRAARSLGMTYWQDLRYVVFPIGLRAVLPAWVGVALGVMKDLSLIHI